MFFIKKSLYKNDDEQIKKILKIFQSIPNNKQIEYKFNVESSISETIGQEIVI